MGNLVKIKLLGDLRLTLRWIYEWNIPPDRPLRKASFPFTIIWIVLDGHKKVDIGGNPYELSKGDIVIIPPSVARTGFQEKDSYGFFHYITLAADIRIGSLEFVRIYQLPQRVSIPDTGRWEPFVVKSRELVHHADQMLAHLQLDSAWRKDETETVHELNTAQTLELIDVQRSFYEWFGQLCGLIKDDIPEQPEQTDKRIQEICTYIKSNISEELTPTSLAAVAFISESHLRLLFRKTFGVSPTEYVRRARMQYARELILNSDYRLSDIARMVGYEDVNRFSRTFSKFEGISAMAYRKQFQSGIK
ncbi:HTH-type transcriptional activator Btr [Paenibacillus solanacearum]|uniref:HTH-type transcriptional activator Btr n=1 Tax=Paenibacillus solanacearum TaxID=2048548 RepID=A0A916NVI8_9BACL|nr:AraC family transcriptional regulator [Paenibacillus solanacearum]CAG7607951.1 HTH-type transcriptional activator Btr [Paenibacillus solanacearum]